MKLLNPMIILLIIFNSISDGFIIQPIIMDLLDSNHLFILSMFKNFSATLFDNWHNAFWLDLIFIDFVVQVIVHDLNEFWRVIIIHFLILIVILNKNFIYYSFLSCFFTADWIYKIKCFLFISASKITINSINDVL